MSAQRPIRAAGGVVWRPAAEGEQAGVEVAVVHRPRYDDWSLPKGKLAAGEPELEAAVREVLEETGYRVAVGRPLGESRYLKDNGGVTRPKVVRWWAMRAVGGDFSPGREVDQLRWLTLAEAQELLTRETDRQVLERFARGPLPTRSVILVRHASAGSRATWPADDRLRPLDECGRQVAEELVRLLSRFDLSEVASADLTRCEQTVEPLAAALDLPVHLEPLLSAQGYVGHEQEAMAMIRSSAGGVGDAVLCTQGEVVPDLLARLAAADGFEVSEQATAKGGAWELTLYQHRVVGADYVPPPSIPGCSEDAP